MNQKILGKQIKTYRKNMGYTQQQLAEKINKSVIFISYIERGEKIHSLSTLIDIANTLHISLDILVGDAIESNCKSNLLYIENKLTNLPPYRQQILLQMINSMVDIELNNQK